MVTRASRLLVSTLAAVLVTASGARAQEQPTEFQSWHLPGWTFTPGVIFGTLHDSNVTLLATLPSQSSASDTLFEVEPFGEVEYFSPRLTLNGGYHGGMRRYFELGALDSTDHRAYLSLRNRLSRRVTVYFNENFAQVPTTAELVLNGVPFQRSGARYNAVAGGFEARVTKSVDFATRYETTWVDFIQKQSLLTGGIVNGFRSTLSHRFNERLSFGGEYEFRIANLNGGLRHQLFQDAGGVIRYRVGEVTSLETAGGVAHLDDRSRGQSRTGPYVRVELVHRARRATVGGEFHRSYVPSVAFGGTNQTEIARGYIQMPLSHNRFYVQETATWHHTDPFDPAVLPLQSAWLNTVLGYAVQRWFRIEAYHALTRQDTRLAGGRINRQVFGVQFVVSEPVRIR